MPEITGGVISLLDRVTAASAELDLHIEREVLEAILGPNMASWPPGWAGLGKHPLSSLDDAFDLMDDAFPDWVFRSMGNFSCPASSLFTATFERDRINAITGEGGTKQGAIVVAGLAIRLRFPNAPAFSPPSRSHTAYRYRPDRGEP